MISLKHFSQWNYYRVNIIWACINIERHGMFVAIAGSRTCDEGEDEGSLLQYVLADNIYSSR